MVEHLLDVLGVGWSCGYEVNITQKVEVLFHLVSTVMIMVGLTALQ